MRHTACYLALRVVPFGGSLKVFSPKIQALQPGQQITLSVQTGFLLSQAQYEAIADRSNTVQETNEANNRNKGQFGGKP
ncbi:CARDB domain-containing protein [Acidovorax sp. BLS4]|uniref:CARDB domain-containing protein n=1 Tax=Acidovorax sp. BLS4 TaxID=3273430 RepID=UPI0029437B7A|nr:CARDB domain-containing protein [Paracidovorax avenae]WOI45167.1 CARDB domain-containing protein [Paracidovorax avenae]